MLVLVVVATFVVTGSKSSGLSLASNNAASTTDNYSINPLNQASSADIALTVAQSTNIPEATAVANQAQTAAADQAVAPSTDNVISKPEIVQTALKSKADISSYTTVAGDSVSSLATKFGINSNSIMWSNNLASNTVSTGTKLIIPPVNGIVYTVVAGDTPASLASKYKADQTQIIAYNDAEITGLTPGEQIIIPNATVPTNAVSATSSTKTTVLASATNFTAAYSGNGYDFGYCTWYVATQAPVPSNWGNASSWADYAALSGWNVSVTPTVGSIAQTADAAGGEGHVAMVTAVNGDDITIRDMNNYGDGGGWDKVGTGTVPISTFQHYITP
jgi:surface antigen